MAKEFEIIRVTAADLGAVYPGKIDFPVISYAIMQDEMLICFGGLCWLPMVDDGPNRCILWLDYTNITKQHAFPVVRMARRMLKTAVQLGEDEVWAHRDDTPTSERLLRMLGFERAEEDGDHWRWRSSPQPHP
jgi:hypothetical protein